jgi:RNA polymerase sigma-70 factor (ECF subfamily)
LEREPDAAATNTNPSIQELESAIDSLPEVFRTVLVLRVVENLSGIEVAASLGLHETTVRTRLYRAQQRLRVDVTRRLREAATHVFDLHPAREARIIERTLARLDLAPSQPLGASASSTR